MCAHTHTCTQSTHLCIHTCAHTNTHTDKNGLLIAISYPIEVTIQEKAAAARVLSAFNYSELTLNH